MSFPIVPTSVHKLPPIHHSNQATGKIMHNRNEKYLANLSLTEKMQPQKVSIHDVSFLLNIGLDEKADILSKILRRRRRTFSERQWFDFGGILTARQRFFFLKSINFLWRPLFSGLRLCMYA